MNWVEGSSNKAEWYGIVSTFLNVIFLSYIDEQSARCYILDGMTEEEDDAYDFSIDYV